MRQHWDLGGLVDENGALGRPLDLAPLYIPENIWLEEYIPTNVWGERKASRLMWSGEAFTTQRPDLLMLNSFVALADSTDERIESYARRYGPLALCKHHLPSSHNYLSVDPDQEILVGRLKAGEDLDWVSLTKKAERCTPLQLAAGDYWEPLSVWRRYAKEAQAILTLTASLHQEKLAAIQEISPIEDEESLRLLNAIQALDSHDAPPVEKDPAWHRLFVRMHIQRWLDLGGVQPRFDWQDGETPHIRLHSNGLFGALALHLAIAAAQGKGIAFCSNCGQPYTPKRTPVANRRSYCDDCQETKAPKRDAARAYRQRKKARDQHS